MGFYLSGHPLDAYGAALKRLGASTYAALLEDRRRGGFKAETRRHADQEIASGAAATIRCMPSFPSPIPPACSK